MRVFTLAVVAVAVAVAVVISLPAPGDLLLAWDLEEGEWSGVGPRGVRVGEAASDRELEGNDAPVGGPGLALAAAAVEGGGRCGLVGLPVVKRAMAPCSGWGSCQLEPLEPLVSCAEP